MRVVHAGRMQRLAAHVLVDDLAPASIQHESLGVR